MEELIRQINALARKAKTEGLTPEETVLREQLRQEYLAAFRANLQAQLDNTYLVRPDGTKEKLRRKSDPKQPKQ